VLQEVLDSVGITGEQFAAVCIVIDKLGKLPLAEATAQFEELGLGTEAVVTIQHALGLHDLDALAEALGDDAISLAYNYSNWAVIESVSDDVVVHVSGDVTYRISASDGYGELTDVPLLVSFTQGGGQVVFSTFHWMAQNPDLGERIMLEVVDGLGRGFTGSGE
jgi:hypothetical protein